MNLFEVFLPVLSSEVMLLSLLLPLELATNTEVRIQIMPSLCVTAGSSGEFAALLRHADFFLWSVAVGAAAASCTGQHGTSFFLLGLQYQGIRKYYHHISLV